MKKIALATTLAVAASGCASFASFQGVETMAKSETEVGLGGTVTGYQLDLGGDDPTNLVLPAANLWVRHGLTDKVELHTRAWLPLGATVGTKVQFLGDRTQQGFGLSGGLDVGYLSISAGDVTTNVLDTYVPLYTGYRISEGFGTYLSPKYLLRTTTGNGTNLSHSVGGTLGLEAGKKTKLYVEGTGVYDLTASSTSWTGGLGVGF